ncbi:hypothetical protein ACJX0J_029543, partial [Zea mays]
MFSILYKKSVHILNMCLCIAHVDESNPIEIGLPSPGPGSVTCDTLITLMIRYIIDYVGSGQYVLCEYELIYGSASVSYLFTNLHPICDCFVLKKCSKKQREL